MNTIEQLQSILPGQPLAWYERIAAEIDAGRMPMPSLKQIDEPSPPPPEPTKPTTLYSCPDGH
jgi:hypothetical protein